MPRITPIIQTVEARAALRGAHDEALALRAGLIGTGHLLLGLSIGDGAAAGALHAAEVRPERLRAALAGVTPIGERMNGVRALEM